MEIHTLLETIRINNLEEHAEVLDFDQHAVRLFGSALELGFHFAQGLGLGARGQDEQILRLKNLVKNEAQYYFKKPVSFVIASPEGAWRSNSTQNWITTEPTAPRDDIYRLRIILHQNSNIDINIEPYTRDLSANWKVKILDPKEFHIDSQDHKFKHKFYPRLDFSKYLKPNDIYDEVIWLNERSEICEGSFTNIFLQDHDGNWFTPSLETNILPGIMRSNLIQKLNAKEQKIKLEELKSFQKTYLSNSMIGLKEISLPR